MAEELKQGTVGDEATAAAAAFANRGGDAPQEPVEAVAQTEEIPAPEVEAVEVPKVLGGMTEAEVLALLNKIPTMEEGYRKQIDNLAGNFGKLNLALQKIQQQTPQGVAVEVTDEDMAELSAEFGEEFAKSQKSVLNKILKRTNLVGTGTGIDEARVNALVEERLKGASEQQAKVMNAAILNGIRPDWRQVIGMPDPVTKVLPETEFRKWLAAQPADYQQTIGNTWEASEIASAITKFETDKVAAEKKRAQNKARLTNAIQPQGAVAARAGISESDAAAAAFRRGRGIA